MLKAAWRSYKRAKDANSHYSVLNNAYLLISVIIGGAGTAGSLAGLVFSYITEFWANYGWPGTFAAGLTIFFLAAFTGTFIALLLAIADAQIGRGTNLVSPIAPKETAHLALPAPSQISEAMMIAGGYAGMPPRFISKFLNNGRNAEVYLRYSAFISGLGDSGWGAPTTLKLKVIDRYIKGEKITVPIIIPHEAVDGTRWIFGCEPKFENGYLANVIGPRVHYRGCVLLVDERERTESCFFLAESESIELMPDVIGEHMWYHSYEWIDRSPPQQKTDSLFVN